GIEVAIRERLPVVARLLGDVHPDAHARAGRLPSGCRKPVLECRVLVAVVELDLVQQSPARLLGGYAEHLSVDVQLVALLVGYVCTVPYSTQRGPILPPVLSGTAYE